MIALRSWRIDPKLAATLRDLSHPYSLTGITAYLQNGGTIGHAQQMAYHPLKSTGGESPRTTKLYDRTSDAIGLDEIERILI